VLYKPSVFVTGRWEKRSADFTTLTIVQKVLQCKVENRLKTPSSTGMVGLHPTIAALLRKFAGDRRMVFYSALGMENRSRLPTAGYAFEMPEVVPKSKGKKKG
jgi:hypothetical protein